MMIIHDAQSKLKVPQPNAEIMRQKIETVPRDISMGVDYLVPNSQPGCEADNCLVSCLHLIGRKPPNPSSSMFVFRNALSRFKC